MEEMDCLKKYFDDIFKTHNLNILIMRIQRELFIKKIMSNNDVDFRDIIIDEIEKELTKIDKCIEEFNFEKKILNSIIEDIKHDK